MPPGNSLQLRCCTKKKQQLSDPKDRQDIAEATLRAVGAMEVAGRIDPAAAKLMRFSAKKVLYGSQDWEGHSAEEEEVLSLRSEKTNGGGAIADDRADARFSRKRGVVPSAPRGRASARSLQ